MAMKASSNVGSADQRTLSSAPRVRRRRVARRQAPAAHLIEGIDRGGAAARGRAPAGAGGHDGRQVLKALAVGLEVAIACALRAPARVSVPAAFQQIWRAREFGRLRRGTTSKQTEDFARTGEGIAAAFSLGWTHQASALAEAALLLLPRRAYCTADPQRELEYQLCRMPFARFVLTLYADIAARPVATGGFEL